MKKARTKNVDAPVLDNTVTKSITPHNNEKDYIAISNIQLPKTKSSTTCNADANNSSGHDSTPLSFMNMIEVSKNFNHLSGMDVNYL